ncbi:MAG: GntR family transcriptional regulator [Alphaproteobacteria bacterium]|nr:GntR family transcriptional regulator [Alphaproteobacteria bacterium]
MRREFIVEPIDGSFSLKEHIYDVLKDAIMAMNIYADDAQLKLDERQLSDQLQISRTPIREALARLEQEGLVRVVPRKGVFILRKSVDEILEMITVWAALESMAARLVTERATDAAIKSLRKLLVSFSEDEAKTHLDEYSEANIRYHRRILELSGCKLLLSIADGLFLHMRAIRARTMTEDNRVQRSVVDHNGIIEAIEARDGDLAERLVREHTMKLHAHVKSTWVEPTDQEAAETPEKMAL